jgi:hypothetical protein
MSFKVLGEEMRIDIILLLMFLGGCIVYFFACTCKNKMSMNSATTLPQNKEMIKYVKKHPSTSCGPKLSRSYSGTPSPYGEMDYVGSDYQ